MNNPFRLTTPKCMLPTSGTPQRTRLDGDTRATQQMTPVWSLTLALFTYYCANSRPIRGALTKMTRTTKKLQKAHILNILE